MKIRMNRSDVVWTDKGPVTLQSGQDYEVGERVPESVVATLVGRGFAVYVKETSRVLMAEDVPVEPDALVAKELEDMLVDDLKEIAKEAGIKGYGNMKKETLIERILEQE